MNTFTAQEIEDMRRFDRELERNFCMSLEEFNQTKKRDLESKKENSHELTTKQRYYVANKEEIDARRAAYRASNREKTRAYKRAYYAKNKSDIDARNKAWKKRNVDRYATEQAVIKVAREAKGLTQKQLAKTIGVSTNAISLWENGGLKANWKKLAEVFPDFEEKIGVLS